VPQELASGGIGTLACLGVAMTPKKLESETEMVASAPHPAEPLHDSPTAPDRSATWGERVSGYLARKLLITVVLVLLVLAGLPIAVWLDLRDLSERTLREQADELSSMIDSIRKVGDVRGIEEFTIIQPIAAHIFTFKYLLLYFAFVAITGLAFIALQRYQSTLIASFNKELARTNEFLSGLAKKIAKYLPP
jgi:hypothetical protein